MNAGQARRRGLGELSRQYSGTTDALRAARTEVVEWLAGHGADRELRDRAALVLSELASNAMQASPGSLYGVRASFVDDGAVVVAVSSSTGGGRPPPREEWGVPTLRAARGWGLVIVDRLSDDVRVDQPVAGTVVVTATLR